MSALFPNHRDELAFWLNQSSLIGAGAEIGVARGDYAKRILTDWEGKKLFLVDPWRRQLSTVYQERQTTEEEYERWHYACQLLASQDERVKLYRGLSKDVVKTIPDSSLDFAYIDANHDAIHVIEDLNNWWPKVRHGGIMGGHDYCTKKDDGWFCEVDTAVRDWCKQMNIGHFVTPCTSWWVRKE